MTTTTAARVEHVPDRPASWSCRACGMAWPCTPARQQLLAEYADDRTALLVYLSGYIHSAALQLPDPPGRLLDRFLMWARQ